MAMRRIVRENDTEVTTQVRSVRKPINAVLTICGSLALGWFLIWIVTVDWVINLMAGAFLLAVCVAGYFVGRAVYKALSPALYHWERIAIAVILGFAVAIALGELTHSHKLIRDYDHYSNSGDED